MAFTKFCTLQPFQPLSNIACMSASQSYPRPHPGSLAYRAQPWRGEARIRSDSLPVEEAGSASRGCIRGVIIGNVFAASSIHGIIVIFTIVNNVKIVLVLMVISDTRAADVKESWRFETIRKPENAAAAILGLCCDRQCR